MVVTHCAVCKNKEKIRVLYPATFNLQKINVKTFSARRTPDRMHHQFVKCEKCGLIFSNPILEPKKIFSLYKGSEFHYTVESTYLAKTYGMYLQKARKSLPLSKKLKLLDIGCGNGFFLEEAKRMGVHDVWGIEPGKETVKHARSDIREKIKVDILRPGLFKKNSFDIITCFHTLDHIIDPNAFLNEVFSLLKKGGKILFIVHNTDGLSVKLFGENSPIFDIEHMYLFNPKSLARICTKNGFKKADVFEVKNTYPLGYWSRMIPLPKGVKKSLLSLLKQTKLENVSIGIKAGNIGIIAEK